MAAEEIVVPVIDLANFPMELKKLAAATAGLGCFRVVNHGFSPALMAAMKVVSRSLFEFPAEAKLRSVNVNLYNGGFVSLPSFKLFEAFGIYNAASKADVHSFCSILGTTIQQREIISEYIVKLHGLVINIAGKVAESVGFSLGGFAFEEWPCHVRLNSYKFTDEEDIGCIGAPAHTDSGFLNVLQEDDCVGGLEMMDSSGNFVAIDPVPNTFLVNIGVVGKVWSNGRLQIVKHRVVCKEVKPRITVGMMLLAPKDDKVEPEAAFVDSEHPKMYQTFVYNEFRKLRDTSYFVDDDFLSFEGK